MEKFEKTLITASLAIAIPAMVKVGEELVNLYSSINTAFVSGSSAGVNVIPLLEAIKNFVSSIQ